MPLTCFVSELIATYHSQRIHRGNINFGARNSAIDALVSKCEAIVRSYDMALEQRAKDDLLSKASKKKKKDLSDSAPIVDKDGFTTVVHKRGRNIAASLDSAPTLCTHSTNDCLFAFYDPSSVKPVEGLDKYQDPAIIPNFYRRDRKTKNFEGI